jgi:hypothetical protein
MQRGERGPGNETAQNRRARGGEQGPGRRAHQGRGPSVPVAGRAFGGIGLKIEFLQARRAKRTMREGYRGVSVGAGCKLVLVPCTRNAPLTVGERADTLGARFVFLAVTDRDN